MWFSRLYFEPLNPFLYTFVVLAWVFPPFFRFVLRVENRCWRTPRRRYCWLPRRRGAILRGRSSITAQPCVWLLINKNKIGKQKEEKMGMDVKPTNAQIKLRGHSLNRKSDKATEIYVKANNLIRSQTTKTLSQYNAIFNINKCIYKKKLIRKAV